MQGRSKAVVGIGSFLFVAGFVVLVFGFLQFQKARESSGWPTVIGTVVSSEVEMKRTTRDAGRDIRITYRPDVEYAYSVNGTDYTSDKFAIQTVQHKNPRAAENDLVPFPVGGDVTVYYDPTNPDSSVLRPGATLVNYLIMLLVGVGMIVGGGASVIHRPKGE